MIGTGLGWRHFDVPACGTCLLSESVLELPETFRIGEEMETFDTPEELRDKASYLLAHETQRKRMVQRARQRVLQEHTYTQRARKWLEWCESGILDGL
jgi:spore maturation protein CgeB